MPGFEVINNLEKKAVNKVFSEGAVFFAHGFQKLRKKYHVREFESLAKKKNGLEILSCSNKWYFGNTNCA